jgi:hypothetical protein
LERFIYTNDEANQLNELIHLAKQFDIHFIYPLNTLGQWFQSLTIDNGEQEENVPKFNNYNVEKALERSLIDWLPEFNQINSANHSQENFKVKD